MQTEPTFAVVGHPNKGKSSIVAALTHTDSVSISALSGTTTQAQTFSFYLAGQPLYHLVDTPGFQRPRQLLELIEQYAGDASERVAAIQTFIDDFQRNSQTQPQSGSAVSPRFKDEVELLSPILAGAGILYVVDGSVPYTPEYEAEMTLLQWTGQPRMALINPIGGEHYIEQWQNALGQFFSLVRVFNPMSATIDKQCAVLSAFAQLCPAWQASLERSQQLIRQQQEQHCEQAAYAIAQFMADACQYSTELPLPSDAVKDALRQQLQRQYKHGLTQREQRYQAAISVLYAHQNLRSYGDELALDYPDIFDQSAWYLFGLSRQKLVALSASAGAAAGAILDVGVGGASLMTGALLGGLTSGAASFYFSSEPEKIRLQKMPLGGQKLMAGPVKNLQFAFVLLGRALRFQRAVAEHSHANRDVLQLQYDNNEHWLQVLAKSEQLALTRLLQKAHKGLGARELEKLQAIVLQLVVA
ncbi:MAG TPA: DUF3482 domain-containing protein [Marinagarivorans sp.]